MLTHTELWNAIDLLPSRCGLSLSGLARHAGLDPTVLNPSKRFGPEGKPRWPSTQTLAALLGAAGISFSEFCALLESGAAHSDQPLSSDIMLVDDDVDIRDSYAAMLRDAGYRVYVASGHAEVLGLLARSQRFDLLCTDVVMPDGLGGPALARAAQERLPALKIMYITGFDIPTLGDQPDLCLLRKPVPAEILVAQVRGLLAPAAPLMS